MSVLNYGIHWFRRDLRIAGNPALLENWKKNKGRVIGLFCFDSKFLSRSDFSHNRFAFFLKTLESLQKEFHDFGGELLIIDESAEVFFTHLNEFLPQKPNLVTWNRDYEPFARSRDKNIEQILEQRGVDFENSRDHLLLEPHEVIKDDRTYYQVYSPFSRKWFAKLQTPEILNRIEKQKNGLSYLEKKLNNQEISPLFSSKWNDYVSAGFPYKDSLKKFTEQNQKSVTCEIPEAGTLAAYRHLKKFSKNLPRYKQSRDFPSLEGTSALSIYLKNGSLSSSQIIASLQLENVNFSEDAGATQYLKEIIWREFYYSILWHEPRVEHEAFLVQYKNIKWQNNNEWFARWCDGETGYPLIDAGMRELKTTGRMHNRVRMVVASFLCKDLLIDWKWGEKYFMNQLLDGDLAPNNGGWQWAASTGCDPQPYFRIFNPTSQSQKFDPEGSYIRKFVPELRGCSPKEIHQPTSTFNYPKPIVDHSVQRTHALELYKSTRSLTSS